MCWKCGEAEHKGKACSRREGGLVDFAIWASKNQYQLCPKCSSRTLKVSGCNHMRCPFCNHEYCWICRKEISKEGYGHFKLERSLFGCAFMMYEDRWYKVITFLISRCYIIPALFWFYRIHKPWKEGFNRLYSEDKLQDHMVPILCFS